MELDEMKRYLCRDGVDVIEAQNALFFVYDPDHDLPDSRRLPFATIVTDDTHDSASDLNRPDTYRLNLGLTKTTYTSMFGPVPTERDEHGVLITGFDYTTPNTVMPHPVYATHHWVCVVNPSATATVAGLVTESYEFAVRKHGNTQARRSGGVPT